MTDRTKDLYFAYGSNLFRKQMADRCPNSTPYAKATLNNHVLCFPQCGGDRWDGKGVAGIERKNESVVEGFLYNMTDDDFEKLDGFEGVADHFYTREYVDVTLENGSQLKVTTYFACGDNGSYIPSIEYIETIIQGAHDNGLSLEYIKKLDHWRMLCVES